MIGEMEKDAAADLAADWDPARFPTGRASGSC
jgi:hypothetical protein